MVNTSAHHLNFAEMPLDDVAAVNTAEALDWFWAHRDLTAYYNAGELERLKQVADYAVHVRKDGR